VITKGDDFMKKTVLLLITLWCCTLSAVTELSNVELNRHFKLDLLPENFPLPAVQLEFCTTFPLLKKKNR